MPAAPAAAKPRLFLIDGYSNIFRAYYAIRNLSSSKGEPTNAVYGFLNMLRKLLREEDPAYVGVALDVGGPTVRSERFVDYKANRQPMPEDLRPQIAWIRRLLDAYRIPRLESDGGYEADDVLGTIACKARDAGYEVTMVSADKDLMQLVGPGISLYHTGREKLYDAALVEQDFGLPPEKVADVLALMGDAVDNVPGVPGIGEKGARSLIQEYGSLDELLSRAGEVSRRSYRDGLLAHREQALLSRELVTIHCDLDVAFDPDALRREEPDTEALREIFSRLEFFSLLEELTTSATDLAVEPAVEATTPEDLAPRLAAMGDRVTVLAIGPEAPLGVALAGAGGEAVWADFRRPGLRQAAVEALRRWLAEPGTRLLGHDVKEVLRLCDGDDEVGCEVRDLMLLAYLANPSLKGYALEEVALEALQHRAMSWHDGGWGKGQEPALGDGRLRRLAAERLELVAQLAERVESTLGEDLEEVYRRIEAPLLPVLVRMEERGVLLDVAHLRRMSAELAEELARLEREIFALAGEELNLNSPRQLGEVMFGKLGYPVIKRTRKTKSFSTDAETLEELAARGFPLPEHILRYRELAKLKGTYVDAFPALVGPDSRLHTRFNQAVAATGRLSSAEPNLQNIPIRAGVGQQIRRAFVAPPGSVLLVADYSQIELRVLAHIAGEERLVETFRAGGDVHAATAASVFGVAPELVSADQRRAAKVINFGIIYGMSAFGLGKTLKISPGEAAKFIEAYLDRFPGVRRYTEETVRAAEAEGKVTTLYGRVRLLPELASRNRNIRDNARRMAINARIQGTAADLLKLAMIAVDRRLRREHPAARLLLTVHDELVLEVPEGEAERVAAAVREEMEGVAELAVPLVVETGWGASWYEAKP